MSNNTPKMKKEKKKKSEKAIKEIPIKYSKRKARITKRQPKRGAVQHYAAHIRAIRSATNSSDGGDEIWTVESPSGFSDMYSTARCRVAFTTPL